MDRSANLEEAQQRTLVALKPLIDRFGLYLAGGTAINWHLGHRRSRDLDLFTRRGSVDLQGIELALVAAGLPYQMLSMTDAALKADFAGTPVDIVLYPYPPLEEPVVGPAAVPTATLLDLAAMKLATVSTRGIRRDFWDLYAICHAGVTLETAMTAYVRRFGTARSDLYHVARSLTWFEDAERSDEWPEGLDEAAWQRIRGWFEAEAPSVLRRLPG